MNTKKNELDQLLNNLSKCEKCLYLKSQKKKDTSLINYFNDASFAKQIPSIWTDWYNRLDAEIMIIGQDWGPFEDMKKIQNLYQNNPTKEYWKNLIETEKSMTKNQLTKYLMISKEENNPYLLDKMYITNAILCARKGSSYRGNNINLKYSTIQCTSS